MAIDNKLSNIIGTKLPQWVINQLTLRSLQNSKEGTRDNNNLIYLSNKTAWVRLVSSVNITNDDLVYFSNISDSPGIISDPSDLAKRYVLYGGTSVYQKQNSYQTRSGISGIKPNSAMDGAYGILGRKEIQDFGYRPMPGISRVTIETQGRLGSVRQAVIEIKCWDKSQLDIIDALYFKLGYTMFIEWGHTYYYPSTTRLEGQINEISNKLKSTELSTIDPFASNLTKESIYRQISLNSRQTDGNYDAMLGIVTNFNFSYNQEGGYDCTLRLMSLGVLGDSIKINNPSILPNILKDEVLKLNQTLFLSSNLESDSNLSILSAEIANIDEQLKNKVDIYTYINTKGINDGQIVRARYNRVPIPKTPITPENDTEYEDIIRKFGLLGSKYADSTPLINQKPNYDFLFDVKEFGGPTLFLQRFGARLPEKRIDESIGGLTLDKKYFYQIIDTIFQKPEIASKIDFTQELREVLTADGTTQIVSVPVKNNKNDIIKDKLALVQTNQSFATIDIPYKGQNGLFYFLAVNFDYTEAARPLAAPKKDIQDYSIKSFILNGETYTSIKGTEDRSESRTQWNNIKNGITKTVINKFFDKNNDVSFDFNLSSIESDIKIDFFDYERIEERLEKTKKNNLFPEVDKFNTNLSRGLSKFNLVYEIKVKGQFFIPITIVSTLDGKEITSTENYPVDFTISFDDTSLIQNVNIENTAPELLFADGLIDKRDKLISSQNQINKEVQKIQKNQQNELSTQITSALAYQSALEIILRTIQVKSLNRAFYRTNKPDLEIGRKVYKYEIWKNDSDTRQFLNQIFSNGIYSDIISTLIDNPNSISNQSYNTEDGQFAVNAKYGFASTLLGSNTEDPFENLEGKEVDYKKLLNSYVVPYQIDQDIVAGIKTNHPVYIPFGFLITLLNHICTLYDTKLESNNNLGGIAGAQLNALAYVDKLVKAKQKPVVYIDYNPELNFFLTCPQHLSTNPWVVLIPYEGTFDDYKKLFAVDVIEGNNIKPLDKSTQSMPLFNPEKQDLLSGYLPKVKDSDSVYRGKIMNVLLNVDYLTSIIKDYTLKDSTNDVCLRPFLEQILSDVNKYLGNFNALRLSYNDASNTYQIVDDQYIPSIQNEEPIPAKPADAEQQNRTEIPLVGKYSIAKSLELKTEISSRLATMLVISSNSNPSEQAQSSINGDSFGFINKNYVDRYIPRKTSAGDEKTAKKDGEKTASMQFNKTVSDFYSKINPAYSDVSQATSFYINKMSIQKNSINATRSSNLIPVSINFSLDGIGGLSMGHAFTVSQNLLPYNYYSKVPGTLFDGYINQVGFAIVGLSHVIENNTWTTSIRTQMMPVKDRTEFIVKPRQPQKIDQTFGINEYSVGFTPNANTLRVVLAGLGYTEKNNNEISNNGDITATLASYAAITFRAIKNKYPDIKIEVTGGNDRYHKTKTPNSKHVIGEGLDFVVRNGTQEEINKVAELIQQISIEYGFVLNNEYDENKRTSKTTAPHFHIQLS